MSTNARIFRVLAAALAICCSALPSALAQSADQQTADSERAAPLTLDELKVPTARIALYPGALVALTISASLYPPQMVQPVSWTRRRIRLISSPGGLDDDLSTGKQIKITRKRSSWGEPQRSKS